MGSETGTKVIVKALEPTDPSQPRFVLQITQMVDTYMIWIGAVDSNSNVGNGESAVLNGNLCKDWACAMPPIVPGGVSAATSLFRSSSSDIALSMAQRLAKRFKKQIFLSVDIPSGIVSFGGGQKVALEAEKGIVATLKEIEQK